jgi:hypothetical protein
MVLRAAMAWGRRLPVGLVLTGLFLAALVIRAAPVIRLDYAPWWDGMGYGYADVWIGQAVSLAEGDFSALDYASEGLLFVPAQALALKIFGIATGMRVWAIFLVVVSAAIAPIAAHTVYLATRQPLGAFVTGTLVVFDPVSAWYGNNGWSDAQTFLAVALACWGFVLCAQRPTLPRLLSLGGLLGMLGLGHTTWLYPALLWALMAPFLLATRTRWFPAALDLHELGSWRRWVRRLAVPLGYFAAVAMALIVVASVGNETGDGAERAGLFNVDQNNQRVLVITYDPSIEWDDWRPSDTARVILTEFPARLPELLSSFVHGHIANAIHLYRWVLLAMVLATSIVIAGRRPVPWPSRWGWLGLAVPVYFLLLEPGIERPAVALTYLTVGIVWAYIPLTRVLMVLFGPILGTLVLYLPLTTQPRHSNAIVFLLLLIAGIAIGLATDRVRRWYADSASGQFEVGQRVFVMAGLIVLIGFGIARTADAIEVRIVEGRYLEWLGGQMGEDALVLSSAGADPWQVMELTGRPVVYDVENGGRLVLESGEIGWGAGMLAEYREYVDEGDVLRALEGLGYRLWFYAPWSGTERETFVPSFAGSTVKQSFELIRVAEYSDQRGRAALMVAP